MFSRIAIYLFMVVLNISWGQAWPTRIHHKNNESLYPAILDFNQEYMGPQDDMGSLPASYENLVHKLYNYLVSPKEKYMKVQLSPTSFTFEQSPIHDESEGLYKSTNWTNISVEDILKVSSMRKQLILTLIQASINRLTKSCDELEETVKPLIINDKSTALENESGLNDKERQVDMQIILVKVKSAKLGLEDLQNRVNFFTKHVLFTTYFEKKIGGLSLQGLLRYTDSVTTWVLDNWISWKLMKHYSNVTEA